jgi:hypothetical protein
MADVRYREVMTILMFLVGAAAAIATLFGYVAWRDRHGRRSLVESSIRRGAAVQADQHAVQDRLLSNYPSSRRAGSHVDHGPPAVFDFGT